MKDFEIFRKSLKNINFYIYALCEINGETRTPFYIGKGKGGRCLQHLKEHATSGKNDKINFLVSQGKLGIDILRHGIKTDAVAKLIESTCIDLMGVGELENKVRGSGTGMGRMTIEEVHNLQLGDETEISKDHQGLAFLLNSTYKSGMSELELFEVTRGIWSKVPRDEDIRYAYATYGGIIKEVYEVHCWVKAGTQQYFTRTFSGRDISARWEFVGRKADDSVRKLYKGKLIKKERSYGTPFIRVGI